MVEDAEDLSEDAEDLSEDAEDLSEDAGEKIFLLGRLTKRGKKRNCSSLVL